MINFNSGQSSQERSPTNCARYADVTFDNSEMTNFLMLWCYSFYQVQRQSVNNHEKFLQYWWAINSLNQNT